MNALSVEIVGHVLAVLDELVVPHVGSPSARAFADICSRLLHQVIVRERDLSSLSTAHEKRVVETERELSRCLETLPGPRRSEGEELPEDILVRAFATDAQSLDADGQRQLQELKSRWIRQERLLLEQVDPEVQYGFASIFNGGRVDRSRVKFISPTVKPIPEMTANSLERVLRGRGPDWLQAHVRTLARLQGGFSKQTLRAHIENTPWGGDRFIIRQDRADAFTQTTVVTEFPVIQALFAAGLTVPEPLCLVEDADLGPPFIVSRRASGANDATAWKGDPAGVQRFSDSLGKQLALLHGIAPRNAGLAADAGITVKQCIQSNIEHWSALGKLGAKGSSRIVCAIRAWLLSHIPASTTRVSVIHGDITLANLLTDGGNVTALLDWEFCHLGDPQEDLNFVRLLTEELGAWDGFMASYLAAGGCPYVPEDATFWRAWASFRSAAGCANALHAYRAGSYGSAAEALTLAVAGINFGPRFQLEAAEAIVAKH